MRYYRHFDRTDAALLLKKTFLVRLLEKQIIPDVTYLGFEKGPCLEDVAAGAYVFSKGLDM